MSLHRTFAATGAALAFATFTPAAGAQADLPIRDTTLANGLRVIVVENHAVPLVTVELDVKNGAYTQTPEYSGLAHLYEHMFFKANSAIPSQEAYLARLRQLGGAWNGTTSEERVNYFVTVGTDSMVPTMQFMEDAVREPLFLPDELVRERPVVTGEFDRNEANPFFHLQRGVDTLLWTPAFYSHKNTIGDRDVILSATQAKMHEIQHRYYVPNNSALILAGDVTPAEGFRRAVQIFGDWPRGADPFATPAPNPPPLEASKAAVVERKVNGLTLLYEWQGPSVGADPRATYEADVLSSVLNNPASPFQKRLVDGGLAFAAQIGYYTLDHVGPISVFAQTAPDKLASAQNAIMEELGKLANPDYIPQEMLDAAQKQLGINALYEREQPSEWAHTIGFWWSVASLDYYRNYVPNMQKITRQDLADYAKRYIIGKPFVVGALLSPEAVKATQLTPASLLQTKVVP
ncbi:MAG TPA: pitrilysin family protein [Gemmatimonadaceae bacterium]|nr:pitrilysin family protein [Gemmatimonadaceae bacterium]